MTDDAEPFNRLTPKESRLHARRLRLVGVLVLALVGGLLLLFDAFAPNRPVGYESARNHFFYGSIGADVSRGIPLKVLRVLPEMFPEHLPEEADTSGYSAFGFIQESGKTLPIGFSVRRQFIDYAGINCAVCHTGTVRKSKNAERRIIAGMPANTVDLLSYYRFLFETAADKRFTSQNVLRAMEEQGIAEPLDGIIYPFVVPRVKEALLEQRDRLEVFLKADYPSWGPGRVNTFDPFKYDQFNSYYEAHDQESKEKYGLVDNPSIWDQARRDSLWLHWDGNNCSAVERNFSAAIAAGAEPQHMAVGSLLRVQAWLDTLSAPAYPYAIEEKLAQRGEAVFQTHCANCHSYEGDRIGTVIPIEEIGTDRHRMNSYTDVLLRAQKHYTKDVPWQFENFRNTNGYAARPLDGIWSRAPYLHNGSVPTMRGLLRPADQRPDVFTRGSDVYNQEEMGFVHEELTPAPDSGYAHSDGTPYSGTSFVYDTRQPGNSNRGHTGPAYGTTLSEQKKEALIEYLKYRDRPEKGEKVSGGREGEYNGDEYDGYSYQDIYRGSKCKQSASP